MPTISYINPFNRQDITCMGEKRFPSLFHRVPPTVGLTARVVHINPKSQKRNRSKKHVADVFIAGVSPMHLKRVQRDSNKVATLLEFVELRNSPAYRHVFDMVGHDIPIHPEYFFAINVILTYYGVEYFDIIEVFGQRRYEQAITNATVMGKFINKPIGECAATIFYVLYVEYQWNPNTIVQMFNNVKQEQIRHSIGRFLRDYDRSEIHRQAYAEIHSRLLMLEKMNV